VVALRRSRMEMYISTLEALANYGPIKRARITYKAKITYSQLKVVLADLLQKNLAAERKLGKNEIVYTATPKARKILSHYEELKEMLQKTQNENKMKV
jgi:predicted transcriptional regulator